MRGYFRLAVFAAMVCGLSAAGAMQAGAHSGNDPLLSNGVTQALTTEAATPKAARNSNIQLAITAAKRRRLIIMQQQIYYCRTYGCPQYGYPAQGYRTPHYYPSRKRYKRWRHRQNRWRNRDRY